jgi:hypothetical protein
MTTIINTPGNTQSEDGAGWMFAIIILLVVIGVGSYAFVHYRKAPAATPSINITLPAPTTNQNP